MAIFCDTLCKYNDMLIFLFHIKKKLWKKNSILYMHNIIIEFLLYLYLIVFLFHISS